MCGCGRWGVGTTILAIFFDFSRGGTEIDGRNWEEGRRRIGWEKKERVGEGGEGARADEGMRMRAPWKHSWEEPPMK